MAIPVTFSFILCVKFTFLLVPENCVLFILNLNNRILHFNNLKFRQTPIMTYSVYTKLLLNLDALK